MSLAPAGPTPLDDLLAAVRPTIPIPGLLVVLPALYFFFRKTWRELDVDAQRQRGARLAAGKTDLRPFIAMPLCALVLTLQEYYGGRMYFDGVIHPLLVHFDVAHHHVLRVVKYDELYGFAWWAGSRIGGYVLAPFVIWKIAFPRDSLLDLGLRARGFFDHLWIYGLFLGVVLPAMWLVSHEPDFGAYYPFYKTASRSWLDFLLWEAIYFAQFFALEIFFRGFWLGVLRPSMGSGAIFAMAVPYCMIHYGKPYLEANGAIVAGIALGSLSMRTRSIYQGFLVHITVAGLMDWLALKHRNALPTTFWSPGVDTSLAGAFVTPEAVRAARTSVLVWALIIGTAVAVMLVVTWRSRRRLRETWARWAGERGFRFVGKRGRLAEETTADDVTLAIGLDGARTVVRARATSPAGVRLRVRVRGGGAASSRRWKKLEPGVDLEPHFEVAAQDADAAALAMVQGDARPELLRVAGRDVAVDYDRGAIAVTFPGDEPDPGMLDAARAVALALARHA